MANFNINNFVINHVLRGIMKSTADNSVMWSINQVTEPTLNITTENAEAVDAIGTTIATFNRGKKAEFSANNSLFDLGLYAAQNGVDKQVASEGNVIIVPAHEEVTVGADKTAKLAHTPKNDIAFIYSLNGDGALNEKLTYNATAGEGTFAYADGVITFNDDAVVGSQYFVPYEYESTSAVAVTGDAINFPKAGKFEMEVLGGDVCNPTAEIHAFVEFPNAKLDANVDISFTTEGNHPFKIIAQQAYCDNKKILFRIIIPNEQ